MDFLDKYDREMLSYLEKHHHVTASVYETLHSVKALQSLKHDSQDETELEAICNLIEVHSPALRDQATMCFDEILENEQDNESVKRCRDLLAKKCSLTESSRGEVIAMLKKIEEMPEEWTIVQLTPKVTAERVFNIDNNFYVTSPIQLTVFKCGKVQPKPFTVTIDVPNDPVTGAKIELMNEMVSIIKTHQEVLCSVHKQTRFVNHKQKIKYVEGMKSVESRLQGIIKVFQDLWLKQWRCLLLGKYEADKIEDLLLTKVESYFTTNFPELELTEKTMMLLCSVVKGSAHLQISEVWGAIQYCFPDVSDKTLMKKIARGLRSLGDNFNNMKNTMEKHPVILIVHESLDCFPWEQLDILQNQQVTRLPSFHFLYFLFKEYKDEIKDGYKVIEDYSNAAYIVNPGTDLKKMEIRLLSFFNYWTPSWTGIFGYKPEKEEFYELLTSTKIFSYNGHGSGSHYLSLDKIQKTKIKSVVLLFGCQSVEIKRENAQVHMQSSHYAYLIAKCPCIVGMLWTVTDTDTDVLTADFLSYWVPSQAEPHWKYVDKTKWKMANPELQFCKDESNRSKEVLWEPKLPKALNMARKGVERFITKASCVVRGLPVKIVSK